MKNQITVIILTLNEEKHIARCIDSVEEFTSKVIVVDSCSTDATIEIAKSKGAITYQNKFINYATQFNWALDNCEINSEWIMRLDADEIVTPQLTKNILKNINSLPDDILGLTINRQIHFLGKWIRHGAVYPASMLRIWRNGQGQCEDRWMDEHIIVNGKIGQLEGDIADINLNNLTWWTTKHNHYANREAIDLLLMKNIKKPKSSRTTMSKQANYKRWVKENIYSRLPLGLRAFTYYIYRYFVRLGFLDGWQGLAFHSLQGFWYRFLVDLKVYELEKMMKDRQQSLEEVVQAEYGYEI